MSNKSKTSIQSFELHLREEILPEMDKTLCEFYCVQNIPHANTMKYKEMFETESEKKTSVLKFISIGE